MLPARGLHTFRPDYGKLPTQKMWISRTENIEYSPAFYCGFKTVLMGQVRAKYKIYKE